MTLLHEQYEVDGDLVLFRCSECGYISMSLGWLHAHIEKHRGYTRFNIQLPLTKTSPGEFDQLLERTEIITVTDTSEISYEQFDGSAEEPALRADGGSLIDKPVIGYVIGPVGDKVTVCNDCAEPDDDSQPIHDSEAYGDQVPYPECWLCEEVMRPDDEGEEEFVTDGGEIAPTHKHALRTGGWLLMIVIGPLHFLGEMVAPAGGTDWRQWVAALLGSCLWAAVIIQVIAHV